jgi:hypothetical protein
MAAGPAEWKLVVHCNVIYGIICLQQFFSFFECTVSSSPRARGGTIPVPKLFKAVPQNALAAASTLFGARSPFPLQSLFFLSLPCRLLFPIPLFPFSLFLSLSFGGSLLLLLLRLHSFQLP